MRNSNHNNRWAATVDGDEDFGRRRRAARPLWWRFVLRSPRDSVVALVAAAAVIAILVNGLFLQTGRHPAPIFPVKSPPIAVNDATGAVVLPRPRPADPEAAKREPTPAVRTRGEIVTDIQRELARRGYYDGPVDGLYGAKTDAAIRDFEQTQGLKPSGDLGEALLQSILRSNPKGRVVTPATVALARKDPIAEFLVPATPRQIISIQRALADYGYGQIKPNGIHDADTRAAIQRFERDRKLPITGDISDRLTRELVALTGRPLD